jgi:hypothetical protein
MQGSASWNPATCRNRSLYSPHFKEMQHVFIRAFSRRRVLHFQYDIVEDVGQVKNQLVAVLVTVGSHLKQCAKEQTVNCSFRR